MKQKIHVIASTTTTQNYPPGITPKGGRTAGQTTTMNSSIHTHSWEDVLGTGKSQGLFMSQETYFECLSTVGVRLCSFILMYT